MSSTQYLISDALWEKIEPRLPVLKTNNPLGTHRRRVDNRDAMNGIFCSQNCLSVECICPSSSAHRRFQEWRDAGVFERFWQNGLVYGGVDWRSLSVDGAVPLSWLKKQERTQHTERNKE